jgi:hypothetical protein
VRMQCSCSHGTSAKRSVASYDRTFAGDDESFRPVRRSSTRPERLGISLLGTVAGGSSADLMVTDEPELQHRVLHSALRTSKGAILAD